MPYKDPSFGWLAYDFNDSYDVDSGAEAEEQARQWSEDHQLVAIAYDMDGEILSVYIKGQRYVPEK